MTYRPTALSFAASSILGLCVVVACGDSTNAGGGGSTSSSHGGEPSTGGSGAGPSSGGGGSTSTNGGGGSTTTDGGGGSTTTNGGAGGGTAGGGQGGGGDCPSLGDACTACASTDCPVTYCNCYNNDTCLSLLACLQGCDPNDPDCPQTCFTNNEDGISDGVLVGDCGATTCANDCPQAAGNELPPCSKCLFTNCETAMNACVADPECSAILTCAQACDPGDTACQQGCAAGHPTGINKALTVQNCSQQMCPNDC